MESLPMGSNQFEKVPRGRVARRAGTWGVILLVASASTAFADFAADGFFTSWLKLGPLTHGTGGCAFPADVLKLDYIAGETLSSEEEVNEATVLPFEGDGVRIDFDVAAAVDVQDTGLGQNPGAPDGEAEWLLFESGGDTIDDNVFYGGDPQHHVTYSAIYLTNTTAEPLFLVGGIGSDDALAVLMDNTYFGVIDACRGVGAALEVQSRFPFVLPPGEHRILVKLFDWEGGSAFRFRLEELNGDPVLEGGDVEVGLEPATLESVPPAPTATATRSLPDGVFPDSAFDVTITVTGGPVTIYENVPAGITIVDDGGATQTGQRLVWNNVSTSVSYRVLIPAGAGSVSAFIGAAVQANNAWLPVSGVDAARVVEDLDGWRTADVADSGVTGAATVIRTEDDPPRWDMTVSGSGHDIWDAADDFRFVWKTVPSDQQVILQARLDSFPLVTNEWGKAGLMMRKDSTQGSPYVLTMIRPGPTNAHESCLQWRDAPGVGAAWGNVLVPSPLAHWIRAIYIDGTVYGFFAPDNDGSEPLESDWVPAAPPSYTLNLDGADEFLAGLAVTSHDDAALAVAEFSNVTIAIRDVIAATRALTGINCEGEASVTLTFSIGGGGSANVNVVETLPAGSSGGNASAGAFENGQFVYRGSINHGDTITYSLTGLAQGAAVTGTIDLSPVLGVSRFRDICPFGCFPPAPGFLAGGGIPSAVIVGPIALDVATNGDCFDGGQLATLDYLVDVDGENGEADALPIVGTELQPDFGGNAGGLGIRPTPDSNRNPRASEGILTAFLAEADLTGYIDFNLSQNIGDPVDDYLVYCFVYLKNNTGDDLPVQLEVGTDDGVKVLVNGALVHENPVCRAIPGYGGGDLIPAILEPGTNVVVIGVVERGGGTGMRLVLRDEIGDPLVPFDPEDPASVEVCRSAGGGPEICDNGIDDDANGQIDCADAACAEAANCSGSRYVRGDADGSGSTNITDGIVVLNFLFLGGTTPPCQDAADGDDSGTINITDGIYILNFLFLGGGDPPAPYPGCGTDPTDDATSCDTSAAACA
jgi:hypothetical protein